MFRGAVGSRCAAHVDQILIFITAFGRGHWLDIKLDNVCFSCNVFYNNLSYERFELTIFKHYS